MARRYFSSLPLPELSTKSNRFTDFLQQPTRFLFISFLFSLFSSSFSALSRPHSFSPFDSTIQRRISRSNERTNERSVERWETKGEKLPFDRWMRAKSLANSFPLIYRLPPLSLLYIHGYPQFRAKLVLPPLLVEMKYHRGWISIVIVSSLFRCSRRGFIIIIAKQTVQVRGREWWNAIGNEPPTF